VVEGGGIESSEEVMFEQGPGEYERTGNGQITFQGEAIAV
jgi:hypothetical protein